MPSNYPRLTHEERCQNYAPRKSGLSGPAFARELDWDRMTAWREARRNRSDRGYRHKQVHGKALAQCNESRPCRFPGR